MVTPLSVMPPSTQTVPSASVVAAFRRGVGSGGRSCHAERTGAVGVPVGPIGACGFWRSRHTMTPATASDASSRTTTPPAISSGSLRRLRSGQDASSPPGRSVGGNPGGEPAPTGYAGGRRPLPPRAGRGTTTVPSRSPTTTVASVGGPGRGPEVGTGVVAPLIGTGVAWVGACWAAVDAADPAVWCGETTTSGECGAGCEPHGGSTSAHEADEDDTDRGERSSTMATEPVSWALSDDPDRLAGRAISATVRPEARCTSCSMCPNCSAVAGRSAGSLAMAFSSTAHSSSDTPWPRRSGMGWPVIRRNWAMISSPSRRSKAARPAMIENRAAPRP